MNIKPHWKSVQYNSFMTSLCMVMINYNYNFHCFVWISNLLHLRKCWHFLLFCIAIYFNISIYLLFILYIYLLFSLYLSKFILYIKVFQYCMNIAFDFRLYHYVATSSDYSDRIWLNTYIVWEYLSSSIWVIIYLEYLSDHLLGRHYYLWAMPE